jgi:hypothetical protein
MICMKGKGVFIILMEIFIKDSSNKGSSVGKGKCTFRMETITKETLRMIICLEKESCMQILMVWF